MPFRATIPFATLIALLGLCLASSAYSASLPDCSITPTSPLVVNVKDKGAKGDGKADDTNAFNKALAAAEGGTLKVPAGTYMIDAIKSLEPKSNTVLDLRGATLKVIPNGEQHYKLIFVHGVKNVTILGGKLVGDRAKHKSKAGEWGMGITINSSENVTIDGTESREMWGDGFYVGGANNVAFCSVVAIHNRRQGLSIIAAKHLLVTDSVFRDTRGTRPMAGIDIEPDHPDQEVKDVLIEHSKFIDNAGGGIAIAGKKGDVANVRITQNVFEGSLPIKIENAPRIHSTQICKNRYIVKAVPASEGFNTFAEPADIVALQSDCSAGRDMRFEINRMNTRKKKPPKN
jgi:polygalacturonase